MRLINSRSRNFYLMLGIDGLCFALALYLSYLLRFDFFPPPDHWQDFLSVLPLTVGVKWGVFVAFGMYKGMWRYTGLPDIWRLGQACFTAEVGVVALVAWLYRFAGYSRGVFVIDGALTLLLVGGLRMAIRTYYLKKERLGVKKILRGKGTQKGPRRCLIVGAGKAGEQVLRELLENVDMGYQVIGFLDDNFSKVGRSIRGLPVLAPVQEMERTVKKHAVEDVFIAMPSATGPQMRRVVEECERAGAEFKTVPGIGELIDGRVSVSQFRKVDLQDLLGRKQVDLDFSSISFYLTDKVVLVTGAGGSIGSELVRQVVRFQPRIVVLVDRAESPLYALQMELNHERGFHNFVSVLGRVHDQKLINRIFAKYQPHVVFHAAAYKHVPLLEENPWEAVSNNILGSKMVMEATVHWQAERFVLVSTDKAVRPTSVMGASKRVTELIMQTMPQAQTRFMAVRFGNVLGSAGSVIPLFQRQIRSGGPVTVTHPEMTRYFMTIPEACQLIVQAGGMGSGGEIFILKMGEPVRIADMARDLIRLSGLEPDVDICIEYTGIRAGEKLYEELITQGEGVVESGHKDIMVLRPEADRGVQQMSEELSRYIDEMLQAASALDGEKVKTGLKRIVPEYAVCESANVVGMDKAG